MTNILAGGGDFKHLMNHIGAAADTWRKDMREHEFEYTRENINALDAKVQESLGDVDLNRLATERDQVLLELMESKSKTSLQ